MRQRNERGSVSIEAAIVCVALMIFIGLAIAVGRYAVAKGNVVTAAEASARAASIERTTGAARSAAEAAAGATLRQESVRCTPVVNTSLGGFSVPVGQPASVTSDVSCTVNLGDITVPGLPGSVTLTASASSPIDTFRERR